MTSRPSEITPYDMLVDQEQPRTPFDTNPNLESPFFKNTKKPSLRNSRIRWVQLMFICITGIGSFFCFDNPQALQTDIQKQFDASDFKFNLLYCVYAFPNIVLPFVGGYIIDRLGVRLGMNLFSFLLIIGQALVTVGAYYHDFNVMLAGRVVFGLGGESLGVAQSVIVSKWFFGKDMALALGVTLCVARLGSSLNSFVTPKLFAWSGHLYTPLAIGAVLCVISWLAALVGNYLDKLADDQDRSQNPPQSQEFKEDGISLKDFKKLKPIFYLILWNGFFLYGGFNGLNNNLNDLLVQRFGFTPQSAGDYIPIVYICAAVIIPLFGMFTDHYGKRGLFMIFSCIIFVADHLAFAFMEKGTPDAPNYHAIFVLFGVGLFYSTYAAVYWPCIPLVVKENLVGSAYGIVTSLQNLMLTVIPLILGYIKGKTIEVKQGYFWTEILLASLVGVGLLLSTWIYIEDLRKGGKLDRPASNSRTNSRSSSFYLKHLS